MGASNSCSRDGSRVMGVSGGQRVKLTRAEACRAMGAWGAWCVEAPPEEGFVASVPRAATDASSDLEPLRPLCLTLGLGEHLNEQHDQRDSHHDRLLEGHQQARNRLILAWSQTPVMRMVLVERIDRVWGKRE